MSRGLLQGVAESPVIFTIIVDLVLGDLVKSTKFEIWRGGWTTSSWLRLLHRRCASGSSVSCSSGSDGGRSDRNIERSGTDSWCRENTLDKPSEDGGLEFSGGWLGSVAGRSVG